MNGSRFTTFSLDQSGGRTKSQTNMLAAWLKNLKHTAENMLIQLVLTTLVIAQEKL